MRFRVSHHQIRKPIPIMATADRATRQRYMANAISIARPISHREKEIVLSGCYNPKKLEGDALAFLVKYRQLFFRMPLYVQGLADPLPFLFEELESLPSGTKIDICSALEKLEVELSTVDGDLWTAGVLGSFLSSAAPRLVWSTTERAAGDNPQTGVYDLLRGAVYPSSRRRYGEDENGEDPPLAEIMALFGKKEVMERMRLAQEAIWDHLGHGSLPWDTCENLTKPPRKKRTPSVRK